MQSTTFLNKILIFEDIRPISKDGHTVCLTPTRKLTKSN
jgi:hypothetical protein